MSRSTKRRSRKTSPGKVVRRFVSLWPILILIGLALAAGGCKTVGTTAGAPVEIKDRFFFRVYNQALQPLKGAVIHISLEAGQNVEPLPLVTDEKGQALLTIKAQANNLVEGVDSADRLFRYRSAIVYRIESPGRLPVWGRADLTDAYEKFSRPSFSETLDSEPKDKSLPLRHTLYRAEDFFQVDAFDDPLARTLSAGLDRLWRTWSFTGRIGKLKPTPGTWSVVRRPEGPYLKLSLDLEDALQHTEDTSVHEVYQTELIPVLDDLAALYAPFVAGWDITFNLSYRPEDDPHALAEILPLRLVFSEETRTRLIDRPGGLNWLLSSAEFCRLKEKNWRPHEILAREDAREDFIWRIVPIFFAPGATQLGDAADSTDTSEESLPVSPGPF